MARRIEELEREIRELSEDERRDLLRTLLDELSSSADPDAEKAWLITAQRRFRELTDKKVRGVPGELVLQRLRSRVSG